MPGLGNIGVRGFDVPDGGADMDIPDVDGSEGTEEGASPISGAEAAPAGDENA